METSTEERSLEQAVQAFVTRRSESALAADELTTRLLLALAAENQRLRTELYELARSHEQLAAQVHRRSSQRSVAPPTPPTRPRVERPLRYWAEHMPTYGETAELSGDEAAGYLARPRIKPHQVTLTEADLARQPSWRKRYLRDHGRPQWEYVVSALFLGLVAVIMAALLWLYLSTIR